MTMHAVTCRLTVLESGISSGPLRSITSMGNLYLYLFTFAEQVAEGSVWTEQELTQLAKAVARYPGGVTDRWEKISQMVGRSVKEVCELLNLLAPRIDNNNNNKQAFQKRTIHDESSQRRLWRRRTKPNAYTSTFSMNA